MIRTVTTIDGDDVTINMRNPRQSEILDLLASRAGLDPGDNSAAYRIALDAVSATVTGIAGEDVTSVQAAAWLDENVSFSDTAALCAEMVQAHPTPEPRWGLILIAVLVLAGALTLDLILKGLTS